MASNATRDQVADSRAMTDAARIRELILGNLFAVFNERCDDSPNRHATAHAHATSHPIIHSLEPGEDWNWCYVD